MLGFIVVILSVITFISGGLPKEKPYYDVTDSELCDKLFKDFIIKYNKKYETEEEKKYRFQIFLQTLGKINKYNTFGETAVHDINKLSDLTTEEFRRFYTGYNPSLHLTESENEIYLAEMTFPDVPDRFDWRDKKIISPVKYQGGCGSCWAFSAIANVESHYAMKYSKIVQFSEQQVVSCDKEDDACCGGEVLTALSTLKTMGGVELEQDYPYISGNTSMREFCEFDGTKVKATIKNVYVYNTMQASEEQLKGLLYHKGPISVAIDASHLSTHDSGIAEHCSDNNVDHAVLLVGYGEEDGVPYWILKNSWGPDVQENGFFRIHRGKNCLSIMATPVVYCDVE